MVYYENMKIINRMQASQTVIEYVFDGTQMNMWGWMLNPILSFASSIFVFAEYTELSTANASWAGYR